MHRLDNVAAWRGWLREAPRPLGLVPTMGALHPGHMALVAAARASCETVAATIFVNPRQFGDPRDLASYPRTLERDLEMLRESGVAAVFVPGIEEMYPEGFATTVSVAGPALGLEGDSRPGHFDGVATVVAKLLLQAMPDIAFFGRKDAQQVAVIRRLIADLNIPVEIEVVPTVREADGLAISSRNALLTPGQRAAAPALFRALSAGRDRFRSGTQDAARLGSDVRAMLDASDPFDAVDYVAAVDPETFERYVSGIGLLAAAVRLGEVRLIDNVMLD